MAFGTDASNRMGSPQAVGGQFYNKTINQSLRFEDGDSPYLRRTMVAGTDNKKFTFSAWIKRCKITDRQAIFSAGDGSTNSIELRFGSSDNLEYLDTNNTYLFITSAAYRDPLAWYHIVMRVDTTQSIDKQRARLYVNGEQVLNFSTDNRSQYALNEATTMNTAQPLDIGRWVSAQEYLDGYMAEVHYSDGYSYGPEYYGENKNGVWIPKQVSGVTYGINGFHMDFSDSSDLGKNIATGNTFASLTSSGFASTDQVPDSPTNNFSILNPLKKNTQTQTFAEGNLDFSSTQTSTNPAVTSSLAVDSGKWYWEVYIRADAGSNSIGIAKNPNNLENDSYALYSSADAYQYQTDGNKRNSSTSSSYGDAWTTGDVLGVGLDLDGGNVYFYKNGVIQNSGTAAYTGLSGEFTSYSLVYQSGAQVYNFGQDATFNNTITGANGYSISAGGEFKYQPPAGYKALKVENLPEPKFTPRNDSIENSFFYTTLYEGNSGGQRVGQFLPLNETKTVNNAIRFEDGDSPYLERTPAAAGNRRTFTLSAWVKGSLSTGKLFTSGADSSNKIELVIDSQQMWAEDVLSGSAQMQLQALEVLKDSSRWYHVVYAIDTTQSTSTDRAKLYVNGNLQTISGTYNTYPDQNDDLYLNNTNAHNIGRRTYSSNYFDGYMADVHFVDGQQLTPSSFGQTDPSTEEWIPKTFTGNHGQNGFHLEFLNDTVGADSANTNSFTPLNIGTANTVIDTPTRSFSTLDSNLNDVGTLSDGNLTIATTTNSKSVYSNFTIPTRGKWYWEMDVENYTSGGGVYVGLAPEDSVDKTAFNTGAGEIIFSTYNGTGYLKTSTQVAATWCNTPGNDSFTADGEIIQFAYNADDGEMFIGKEGTWFRAGGTRDTFANATKIFQSSFEPKPFKIILTRGGSYNETYRFNFGQESANFSGQTMSFSANADGYFAYEPPTGYKALNVDNFPQSSRGIARRKTPVITWIKNRDSTDSHMLFDTLRGPTKVAHPDVYASETTEVNTLQKFLPGGFQIGNDVQVNTAGESYVAWNWCMHDNVVEEANSAISGSGFTDAKRLVDKKVGLSIVTYTASAGTGTIDHGLGQTPDMIIATDRDHDTQWFVWHKDLANAAAGTHIMNLDSAAAEFNPGVNHLNDTAPTASAFAFGGYMGAHADTNSNGQNKMLYSFKSVPGFSAYGKYEGNGNADGAYVHCGFKPSFVMMKRLASGGWHVFDNQRSPTNANDDIRIEFDNSDAENNGSSNNLYIDFVSNGFKLRTSFDNMNGSSTYIYWAMADQPFKYSNAR